VGKVSVVVPQGEPKKRPKGGKRIRGEAVKLTVGGKEKAGPGDGDV